jgi:tRNA(fMet)-specific endonuclease VapC
MEFLLDTNAFVQIARSGAVGQRLLAELGLSQESAVIASSVTLGEIEYLARYRGWNAATIDVMKKRTSSAFLINPDGAGVSVAYSEIKDATRSVSNRDNDVWIAASARATGACLVSSDNWFLEVGGFLLDLAHFDSKTGKVTWYRTAR